MADALVSPSPLQLRAELEALVRDDLLGPKYGSEEELTERVRDRYIIGLVAPRGQSILPDEQDDPAAGGDGGDQDGRTEAAALPTASMLPSSIGLTFTVDGDAGAIQAVARWGRYRRMLSQTPPETEDKPRLVWKRRQVEAVSEPLPIRSGEIGPWQPDPASPEVYVRGLCRRSGACWAITLFLANSQQEPKSNKDEAWLFQPELSVRAPRGEPIFVKRQTERGRPGRSRGRDALPPRSGVRRRARHRGPRRTRPARFRKPCGSGLGAGRLAAHRDHAHLRSRAHRAAGPGPRAATDRGCHRHADIGRAGARAVRPIALAPLAEAYAAWITAQEARLADPAPDLAAYAQIRADAPFTYDNWPAAVRRGETFVTYGPLLDFAVDGKPLGSRIAMSARGGTVDVTWQAASVTVPMSRVELIVNGEIRESVAAAPWQAAGAWRIPMPRSGWLALLVRGQYADKPEMIAAHSSPVLVEVAGSPILAAADAVTILEQIEGAAGLSRHRRHPCRRSDVQADAAGAGGRTPGAAQSDAPGRAFPRAHPAGRSRGASRITALAGPTPLAVASGRRLSGVSVQFGT